MLMYMYRCVRDMDIDNKNLTICAIIKTIKFAEWMYEYKLYTTSINSADLLLCYIDFALYA